MITLWLALSDSESGHGIGLYLVNVELSDLIEASGGGRVNCETMGYNGLGDLDYTLDFKNRKADYVYDYVHRDDTDWSIGVVNYYGRGGTQNDTVSYIYDAFGRPFRCRLRPTPDRT